ncbi:hypothetical protein F4859DRAFT_523870 [Xylaria cf. heliscus]|nr:hypothetical protein F4859DRAFT_523870 [Xylaria cf. heliscus]
MSIMIPIPQLTNYPQHNIQEAHSHKGEVSDLIFSFDNDLDIEHDVLDTTGQQSCEDASSHPPSPSPSSASQKGYIVISYPDHGIKGGHTLTNPYSSDASSVRSCAKSRDKHRKRAKAPLSTKSPEYVDHHNTQSSSSSSYLNISRGSTSPHRPEPATPRTTQFKESMLSMLSLLPPGRYLSPSPSIISEDRFEADDPCATSPVSSPVLVTTAHHSLGNR